MVRITNSKLPNVGETIFTTISMLAKTQNAINLGQGFPDFSMDPQLMELVNKAMHDGHNQYAHRNGVPVLRERIAEKVHLLYQFRPNPDSEICITPGATYAIYTALTSIINKGDEVIVFEPAYDSYVPNIEINGGVPVLISLPHPDYRINWEEVRKKITPRTKAIILNSPHNPTGTLLSKDDIDSLRTIVSDTQIIIISDEVYEHLIFDDQVHESIIRYPDLYERSFVIFSFGKVYHCTGWKTGYCIAPPQLMEEFLKVHQYNAFCCFSPVQFALADYLSEPEHYLNLGKQLQKKRDFFNDLLASCDFLEALPTHGTYFQLVSYRGFSDESEIEFAKRLITEAGVATIPVSAFYQHPQNHQVLRFCFAKKEETIAQAIENLMNFKNKN